MSASAAAAVPHTFDPPDVIENAALGSPPPAVGYAVDW
jgi:hypothetical protein